MKIFNSGLEDLEKEIKEMSKEEIETEKPYNIVKVVKMILDFNLRYKNTNTKPNA